MIERVTPKRFDLGQIEAMERDPPAAERRIARVTASKCRRQATVPEGTRPDGQAAP
jgi:hypothetical protein